jgi:hypothetical protein
LPPRPTELDAVAERRTETSDLIVESKAANKLIIAGPGTGKTYNFRRALEAVGGNGLALTFIRALVADLQRDLGELAQVNTFHGFCKHLAHRLPVDGLTRNLDYDPPLLTLMAKDMTLLGELAAERDLTRALHNLDDAGRLITTTMELAAYYDAVSHSDVVYRALVHLDANRAGRAEIDRDVDPVLAQLDLERGDERPVLHVDRAHAAEAQVVLRHLFEPHARHVPAARDVLGNGITSSGPSGPPKETTRMASARSSG